MPKVLVLFYSRTGNTAALADAIADGASSVKYTEVDVRRIPDLDPEHVIQSNTEWAKSRDVLSRKYKTLESVDVLPNYDALILGSPSRLGVMSAELKSVLDQTGTLLATGALADKVGSVFSTASTPQGGLEPTLHSMLVPMMHHGMILVPPGYSTPAIFTGGSPYGATATNAPPTEEDLRVARHQGARVAKVSEWVRHARSHAHSH